MRELAKLAFFSAVAATGLVATMLMWSLTLKLTAELILLPLAVAGALLKVTIAFIALAVVVMIVLPLIAAAVALLVPLVVAFFTIGAICAALFAI